MTQARLLTIVSLCVAGCASPYDQPAAFVAGWRVAEVVEVGSAAALTHEVAHDCRDSEPHAQGDTYALLRYATGNRFHRVETSTVVPAGAGLHAGERVHVNIHDCAALPMPHDGAWATKAAR